VEKVLFHLGPVAIYKFGVTIALGAFTAYWLANKEAKRAGLDAEKLSTLFLLVLIAGLIGARLFYVLAYDPAYYWRHPADILKIYEGGLSIHGGILGGFLAGLWYTLRNRLAFWPAADVLAPLAALGQGIARVGCDIYGRAMVHAWPWGIEAGGRLVHPVQIYETLLDLALFLYLWGKRDRRRYSGQIFVHYLAGYACIRLILEFFRTNPVLFWGITPAHLTSVVFILLAWALGIWLSKRGLHKQEPGDAPKYWVHPRVWASVIILAVAATWVFYVLAG
jgi:phosphatidylglycerol:prolipoprotein diacylglycerol transferase